MTIRRKLLAVLATTAALASLLVGLGTLFVLRSAVEGRYIERLRAEADLIASWTPAAPAPGALERLAGDWGQRLDLRVTFISNDGHVLGDSSISEQRLESLENHLHRPEVQAALRNGWGQHYRTSASTGETFFYLARRYEDGAPAGPRGLGFVRIALPAWEVQRAEAPFVWLVLGLSAVAPLVLTGLAYFAVRRWSRPLERLAMSARHVAGGHLDDAIAPVGAAEGAFENDEIGTMALALEHMRNAMTGKIHELDAERRFLQSVIAGMKEGLLLVDDAKRVRLANVAFRQTWGVRQDPAGRPLVEVVRNPQVLDAVQAALREHREVRLRVGDPATGRTFEMHASPIAAPAGTAPSAARGSTSVVVLFFDVTRLEALEALRKEFVANVSHELRTPLTSIKGAVLTLLEGGSADPDASARFLGTIRRNTERMAALVEDLTDLSLIETGAIKLDRHPVEVGPLVRDVVGQLAPRYRELALDVAIDVPEHFALDADPRRLEQVLVNLLDNAMKFNRPGGRVEVSARRDEDRAVVIVADTGPGIPSDDLEKIFHRFYRVDPARSRALGGTGLGLAIVKHLVQLHGGSVRAESELGRGSRFTIEM